MTTQLAITSGFVQLGHDIETIIGSAYPSFGFGGRNSAGHQFLTSFLVINLTSVPGGQLVNSPTAQSLERYRAF